MPTYEYACPDADTDSSSCAEGAIPASATHALPGYASGMPESKGASLSSYALGSLGEMRLLRFGSR